MKLLILEPLTIFLKHPVKQEKVGKATGWHFNKKGHTVHDMVVTILEKVHTSDKLQREERENMYIREFNTKYKGINRLG